MQDEDIEEQKEVEEKSDNGDERGGKRLKTNPGGERAPSHHHQVMSLDWLTRATRRGDSPPSERSQMTRPRPKGKLTTRPTSPTGVGASTAIEGEGDMEPIALERPLGEDGSIQPWRSTTGS